METFIKMPNLGAEATEGIVVAWHRGVGDHVATGDVIAEIETEKATVDLEAPIAGRLTSIVVAAGMEAPVGATLAVIQHD